MRVRRMLAAGGFQNLAFYDILKELSNGLDLIMTSVSLSFMLLPSINLAL
jgi:hypothetical protein